MVGKVAEPLNTPAGASRPESRQHYRVRYPPAERPNVEIGGKFYPVLDLSESGLRFVAGAEPGFAMGTVVEGALALPAPCVKRKLKGRVVRLDHENNVAIRFDPLFQMPFAMMITEQRRLIAQGYLE
ncbi:MAG: PilZ domain-containing protein [Myxococcota bacterium]